MTNETIKSLVTEYNEIMRQRADRSVKSTDSCWYSQLFSTSNAIRDMLIVCSRKYNYIITEHCEDNTWLMDVEFK